MTPQKVKDGSYTVNSNQKIIEKCSYKGLSERDWRKWYKNEAVEDFRVLGLYIKTHNKWYLCEFGHQKLMIGIGKGSIEYC